MAEKKRANISISDVDLNSSYVSRRKYLTANDLVERLLLEKKPNELVLWPPNLFAFTSYVLSVTSSYQLVVSPPRNKKWPPRNIEIKRWLHVDEEKISNWLNDIGNEWGIEESIINQQKKELEKYFSFDFIKYLEEEIKPNLQEEIDNLEKSERKTNGKSQLQVSEHHIFSPEFNNKDKEKKIEILKKEVEELNKFLEGINNNNRSSWVSLVKFCGLEWQRKLEGFEDKDFTLIDFDPKESINFQNRGEKLLRCLFKYTPFLVLICWINLYNEIIKDNGGNEKDISKLLCNQDIPESSDKTKKEIEEMWDAIEKLLTVHAIVDETCIGWGIQQTGRKMGGQAQEKAELLLSQHGTLSTVSPERCRVLPKRHNPNVGITLRSLSCNLAFYRSSIEVVWRQSIDSVLSKKLSGIGEEKKEIIKILLLPWPLHIQTKEFTPFKPHDGKSPVEVGDNYSFFVYEPEQENSVVAKDIIKTLQRAEGETGDIDILVMPESALSETTVNAFETGILQLIKKTNRPPFSIYVFGVREEEIEGAMFNRNAVYCKSIEKVNTNESKHLSENEPSKVNYKFKKEENDKFKQYKHHRWKLNKSQIQQYALSHVLSRDIEWWEAIKIARRRVSFINIGDRLTLCPLICEDLARQDPIADLIRHVGPSLVVTILMDGPQKVDRWSSRYAGVLSEDPGCAVLTLTSFGMVRRWNTPFKQMSRVVALWNDGNNPPREIELEQGAKAIVLTLEITSRAETTADGRVETFETSVLNLVDVIQIYSKSEE